MFGSSEIPARLNNGVIQRAGQHDIHPTLGHTTAIHGGVGGTSNGLITTHCGLGYTYLETATAGTSPVPPAPTANTLRMGALKTICVCPRH